jgi:hypothetical protein
VLEQGRVIYLTKYEEIKKGATFSPNKFVRFAKNKGKIGISILPDYINDAISESIDNPRPNKNYYIDDGKYTVKISVLESDNDLEFSYFIKYNSTEKIATPKTSYEAYLTSSTQFVVAGVIVVISLVVCSLPILKGILG